MTNRIRKLAGIAALMAGFAVVTPAMADGHGGGGWHGGGHGGGHGNGWGWGIFGLGLGLALTAPYYAPAYYPPTYYQPAYYPPAYYPQQQVIVQQQPVYVEQSAQYMPPPPTLRYAPQAPASEGNNWWYHCSKPNGYYPYVNSCPGGWQKVSPTPPG